eukprot:gnl/TRDRNA2_/TRDRNA2_85519_c0_seq2.p1 gnl/TRDRNA2_/TRDRNA2_85519_c0~~gnl/TRDRNA2_/TRDRNA2_85519_c0_seq2.p1  ORF type:complete len:387 (+),score=94.28 gnl/TRDRNA2_/TRDRNA2_85519_c0_seq2:43-1161(+)
MGQAETRPSSVGIVVFEPLLVPRVRGKAFVVLRTTVGGKSHTERIDSFPAFRTLPVSGGEAPPTVLYVDVLTAPDTMSFRGDINVRLFASVPVPLKSFAYMWQQAPSRVVTEPQRGPTGAACFWLGLSEDEDSQELDVRTRFERAKVLGGHLPAPKVGLAMHSIEEVDEALPDADRESATSSTKVATPAAEAVKEVLGEADVIVRAVHRSIEEAYASWGDYDTLLDENTQLRLSIEQQREKYEGLIVWLKDQVSEANGVPHDGDENSGSRGSAESALDRETRRLREEVAELRATIQKIDLDIAEQQVRAETITQHALAAKQAKEEAQKLFGEKHQDIRWMGAQLAESGLAQETLRRRLEELRRTMLEEDASA